MSSINTWDAHLYDDKISFVSEFGKDVVSLLNPKRGEKILDLGCGTGDLTYEIAKTGAVVIGSDLSESMLKKARIKYPNIKFIAENGENFQTKDPFDAVFSNAALHWMKNASQVADSVRYALRVGGRFVAEFGGSGNVVTIIKGISEVILERYGIDVTKRNPWYFPSIGEYSSLLEKHGFRVAYAHHFDRPTQLGGGEENGLKHWIDSFADDFFIDLNEAQRLEAIERVIQKVRPQLYKHGNWFADYKRIRIVAFKEN